MKDKQNEGEQRPIFILLSTKRNPRETKDLKKHVEFWEWNSWQEGGGEEAT